MPEFNIKKNAKKDTAYIDIKNQLTVNNIQDIYNETLKIIETCHNVELLLKEINNIDICGLQFIAAIERYCKNENKHFSKNVSVTDVNKVLLQKTGFENYIN